MAFPPMAGLGPTPGATALDGPPPSPTPMGGPPGSDVGAGFSMSGLAGQLPSSQMPPEVLTGVTQSAQPMKQLLDSWAQIAPDVAVEVEIAKQAIDAILNKLQQSGSGPVSPTAPGPAFPGGGIDQGIAGPGSI
jgi:hypothetical protein